MLRLVRAVIPVAVLMMLFPELAMASAGKGTDLMAKGNDTVKATFGKDSSIVKWVVLAEVLVGAVMYSSGRCKPGAEHLSLNFLPLIIINKSTTWS